MGTVKYKLYLICLCLVICSCNNQPSALSDEAHRPSDWTSTFELDLGLDSISDEIEHHEVISAKTSNSLESLVDQIWKMAFSGDARVYGTNAFGEMDQSNELEPDDLLTILKELDTISIEDIHSGEFVDTVIDLSFNIKSVSALVIFSKFGLNDRGELAAEPYAISIGRQVFEEETGKFRGISNKFFVGLKSSDQEMSNSCDQRFCLMTDSLGIMRVSHLDFYQGSNILPFQELVSEAQKSNDSMNLNFDLSLGYIDQRIVIKFKQLPAEA